MYYRKNGQIVRPGQTVEGYNKPLEKFAFQGVERYGSNKSMNVWILVLLIAIVVIVLGLIGWFIWLAVKTGQPKKSSFRGRRMGYRFY